MYKALQLSPDSYADLNMEEIVDLQCQCQCCGVHTEDHNHGTEETSQADQADQAGENESTRQNLSLEQFHQFYDVIEMKWELVKNIIKVLFSTVLFLQIHNSGDILIWYGIDKIPITIKNIFACEYNQ